VRPGSELGCAQRFQCGEIAQAANLDADEIESKNETEHGTLIAGFRGLGWMLKL
jgi:hypothetical protein